MHGARADCLVDNSDRAIGVRQVDGMTSAVDTYRAAVPAHLEMWNLADPGRLLHDLAAESPLLVGRSLLCQVARPATDQQLVAFTDAWPDGRPIDEMAAQDRLEDAMRRIGHRDVVSVLRYANNRFQALRGELVIVTPHGWIAEPHGLAGLEPVAVLPSAGAATVSA
jgi:hypothetical protein